MVRWAWLGVGLAALLVWLAFLCEALAEYVPLQPNA